MKKVTDEKELQEFVQAVRNLAADTWEKNRITPDQFKKVIEKYTPDQLIDLIQQGDNDPKWHSPRYGSPALEIALDKDPSLMKHMIEKMGGMENLVKKMGKDEAKEFIIKSQHQAGTIFHRVAAWRSVAAMEALIDTMGKDALTCVMERLNRHNRITRDLLPTPTHQSTGGISVLDIAKACNNTDMQEFLQKKYPNLKFYAYEAAATATQVPPAEGPKFK